MFGGISPKIEDLVVQSLASKGRMSAGDISHQLTIDGYSWSPQAIYRVLRKLTEEGVLTKERRTFSVSMTWLMRLRSITQTLESTYFTDEYLQDLLPPPGSKHTWHFPDIHRLQSFRSQILLALAQMSTSSTCLSFQPHQWDLILHQEHLFAFLQAFYAKDRTHYVLTGNRTYLDKYAQAILQGEYPNNSYYLASEEECIDTKGREVHVIGNYIVTIKLDQRLRDHIDTLYTSTLPLQDVDSLNILPIMNARGRQTIRIEYNEKKAAQIARRFYLLFGPLK
ncbi:MAG: hypothetical protein HOE53_02870 [Candidatus Magasanikbacteria bacterium]|jgi:predicted transcriptional regulator|nr:hypothetical protein [Candidatus Magasanikbacteria bacterium]